MSSAAEARSDEELVARLGALLVECLELDREPGSLTPDASLRDELGLDSAGLLELVAAIEDAFAIEIDTEEITEERFASLASLAALVREKR